MKKKYVKPEIVFENFSLSTNIAGNCEYPTNTASSGNCALKLEGDGGGMNLFFSSMTACTTGENAFPITNDGEFNGICYHVPTEDKNIFNS